MDLGTWVIKSRATTFCMMVLAISGSLVWSLLNITVLAVRIFEMASGFFFVDGSGSVKVKLSHNRPVQAQRVLGS